jgi:hypothetical protein
MKPSNYFVLFLLSTVLLACQADNRGALTTAETELDIPDTTELGELIDDEWMGESLKPIRAKIRQTNAIKRWTAIDKRARTKTTEGGVAEYYFLHDTLRKVVVLDFGETGKKVSEFLTLNDSLYFVLEQVHSYNRPITWDSIAMKENNDTQVFNPDSSEIVEDRWYFENGVLIKLINSEDCDAPFAREYLEEEQSRLQTAFDELLERLK